jgi:hypothetical protein
MTHLRISAKNLGAMSLPEFCPRCCWFKLKTGNKLPFQIFPGIFSSIDAYTKRVVHGWIDELGAPAWLDGIGSITGYIDPPSYHTFQMTIEEYDILLTGAADGILKLADGTIAVIDYKTAKYTANQDALLPMYEAQLNGYALIAEHLGMGTVSKLALMYAEPVTDEDTARTDAIRLSDGFNMQLAVSIHGVPLETERLTPLFQQARRIHNFSEAPERRQGCKDCEKLDNLMLLARKL